MAHTPGSSPKSCNCIRISFALFCKWIIKKICRILERFCIRICSFSLYPDPAPKICCGESEASRVWIEFPRIASQLYQQPISRDVFRGAPVPPPPPPSELGTGNSSCFNSLKDKEEKMTTQTNRKKVANNYIDRKKDRKI